MHASRALPVFAAIMIALSTLPALAQTSLHDDLYVLRSMRVEGTSLAIVRLGTKTGSLWLLEKDVWVPLAPPRALSLSTYDCELVPVGKKSWILTLLDSRTGETYIYASATKGWRFAGEKNAE